MKKIFLSSLFVNVLIMAINFVTGVLSARFLGPEGRGELAVINRWTWLFYMVLAIGLPPAVTFLGKQLPAMQRQYVTAYLLLGFLIGGVGIAAAELLVPMMLSGQSNGVVYLTTFSMLLLPTMLLGDGLIGTLGTLNQFRKVLLIRFLTPFGVLITILVLVSLGRYSVESFVYVNFIFSVFVFALLLYLIVTVIRPNVRGIVRNSRQLLAKGRQMYTSSLVSFIGEYFDQIIISLLLTSTILGYYSVASSLGSLFPQLMAGAFSVFLLPKLMDLKGDEKKRTVERLHGSVFYGSWAVTLVIAALLPFVLPILYGKPFSGALVMGEIFLISSPFRIASFFLASFVTSEDKIRFMSEAEVIGLVAGAAVTMVLLPVLQGEGAAVGLASAAFAKWAFYVYRARQLGILFSGLMKPDMNYILSTVKGMLSRGTVNTNRGLDPGQS